MLKYEPLGTVPPSMYWAPRHAILQFLIILRVTHHGK